MAPRGRLELPTLRLTAECSAIELTGNGRQETCLSRHKYTHRRGGVSITAGTSVVFRGKQSALARQRKWTQQAVLAAIQSAHATGRDLSYSGVAEWNLALLRAAERCVGSWSEALEQAGVEAEYRRRRRWTRESVVAAIRQIAEEGGDLSWTGVVMRAPGLAAAACRRRRFGSWRNALMAAGVECERIGRYRRWTEELVVAGIRRRRSRGEALNAAAVEDADAALISAARRLFGSWNAALEAAGLDARDVAIRRRRVGLRRRTGGVSG